LPRHRLYHPFVQVALLLFAFGAGSAASVAGIDTLSVRIVRTLPHDPGAFTQGLVYLGGGATGATFLESTGLYGHSTLRLVEVASGDVLASVDLPSEQFGEGLADDGRRLVQLTWRSGVAHIYSRDTLARIGSWDYTGEGWGLCYDGTHFVMSDGSATLQFRDGEEFEVVRTVDVALQGTPIRRLNELECVAGAIYANVWGADQIVKLDPASGEVLAVVDAAGLLSLDEKRHADVLNGIAYAPEAGTFYITGKLWPKVFEVALEAAPPH
jgi:glutaminyl-peptide cyclotransferase